MTYSSPLVTVYITNYNYGKYIRAAIDSVLNQTLESFELIIIDDGSTDESKSIIEEYESNPKITVIYQKNKGLNVSNNVAMRVARGKYIIRLDADDWFHESALDKLSSQLESDNNVGLVFPDYYLVDESGSIYSEIKRHDFSNEVTLYDQPAHGACTMIRLTFLMAVGGYDESFSCQDGYDLWIKFVTQFKVINVNEALFYYRQHGSNLTKNESRLLETRMAMKKKFLDIKNVNNLESLAIIPVRKLSLSQLPFETLEDKTILEIKIETALQAELIKCVVITSSDHEVLNFVTNKYVSNKRVICIERPEAYERHNSALTDTIDLVFKELRGKYTGYNNIDSFILLSIEYPFLQSKMIDSTIRTAYIFGSDSVITVRADSSTHYCHTGSSMRSIHSEALTKYERDDLYEAKGGLTFSTLDILQKEKKLPAGKVGHIIVDQVSGMQISTAVDLNLAKHIYENMDIYYNSTIKL
ncbi:glycosyltransferase family 2 protein [Morganella morganii]|uniref:glycosyltransferase family 2 protein n=1 Tax=Morganella morganii TaxID=582 RepID=UPI0032DBA464